MSFFSPILAQVDDGDIGSGDELRNRLITFGVYAAIMLGILIWVIFIRKQRKKRRRVQKHRPHNWELSEKMKGHRRPRRRPSKTPELPKNPSRAEAGGLPPRREEPPPPDS